MATIMEMLNQGIGGLNTPMGQLGTQLLANAGPQQGNPSGGARLGQALAGMSEMQRAQALQQYRAQQIQLAEQQQQMTLHQARAKQEAAQRQQHAFADPNLQAQLGPMAKQLAALGIDPEIILKANSSDALQQHRAAQLQQQSNQFAQQQARLSAGGGSGGQPSGTKTPTPRMTLDEPLGDGMVQRHKFDASTGSYVPFGRPFRQFAPTKSDPMQALMGEVMPDDNAGTGTAVPGLPGAGASAMQPPARQGAELLTYGGANPMASKSGTAPSLAKPTTKAEYDALPAGSQYIDPTSGRVVTKKGR
ncbi:hypothetical protein [Pseudomonas sp. P1.31]|uniref:hypothetical protein n=1 Tax=Pseudomonas sp. P1.31 TaxID=1699311 RepID=UPI000B1BB9B6|nr:hypothetical protein [Pseudomonas sp. P1.31]